MNNKSFSNSPEHLSQLVEEALVQAKIYGASAAEAEVSEGFGYSVTVRLKEVETIEYNRDKDLSVTVYFGQKKGHASTSDLSHQALKDTVEKAATIAKYTAADEFAGLAEASLYARPPFPQLDLYHPWNLPVEKAVALATRCEEEALKVDKNIQNSEGATVYTQESQFVYGNSAGFLGGFSGSSHGISCSVIAGADNAMQRDYWYTTARDAKDMDSAEKVGFEAGMRTVRRLNARRVKTCKVPVLFDATLASGLLGHFVGAVSGGAQYRKSSFLLNTLDQQIFAPQVQIIEDPFILKGLASSPFDDEGVATKHRQVVKDGILQGYFLSSYSARKLGMQTTGNSGGSHNLIIQPFGGSFEELLKQMGTGLWVTELLGHGVNSVTGDYSRGAAGFWVEKGEVQYPVQEITIAGNLKEMFKHIVGVGNDVLIRGSKITGSILIESMTVAGE
ncbi:MAG: metalloprotease PmbA [Betaproteobacteria bacterium]|nr:metalloprotease PmbA [Betaproteobacteria bacterium]